MNAFLSLRGLLAAKLLAAALLAAAPIDASLAANDVEVLINKWPIIAPPAFSDLYLVINGKTGKCLTIAGGTSPANNLSAVQFDCDGDLSRTWLLNDVNGAIQIQNAKTLKCLTIAGGTSSQDNLEAVQFDCDSDPSRFWRLERR